MTTTYPNGRTLHHVYGAGLDDAIGRVSALADNSSGTSIVEGYTYLGLGTVVARTHPQTGVDLTLIRQPGDFRANPDGGDQYTGLDRFGRVIDVNWARTGGSAARYQYGHDRAGNALYRADLVDAALSELYHPDSQISGDDNTAYDALGRLRGYRRGVLYSYHNLGSYDVAPNATADRAWSLDALGNWVGTSGSAGSTTRTFNAANQETSSSAGAAPTFDANGNTLTAQGKSYTYDAWDRLVAVRDTASNALLASYGFDALRRRITETHGAATTHVYFTPSWQVVEERVGGTGASATATQYVLSLTGSIVLRDQVAGGSVVASARLYALTDANGNVVALVDPSGVAVERYICDPYGSVQVLDGSGGPRAGNVSAYGWQYRFQGGRIDTATGLYLFQHRDYDPAQGRWIERDPIGLSAGDANIYRFVGNNPVAHSDPSGLADFYAGGQPYVYPWRSDASWNPWNTVTSWFGTGGVALSGAIGGGAGGAITGGAMGAVAGAMTLTPQGLAAGTSMGITGGGGMGALGGGWAALTLQQPLTAGDALGMGFDLGWQLGPYGPLAPWASPTISIPVSNLGRTPSRPLGARGPVSCRNYDPENAGGPIRNLTTDRIRITHRGVDYAEQHLTRFVPDKANQLMIQRLRDIADGKLSPTQADLNFYSHELRESIRYRNLGYRTGEPLDGDAAYDLWNNAHTATLEDYRLREGPGVLYHPSTRR